MLLWFKIYIDNNPDLAINRTNYKIVFENSDSRTVIGIIKQDESGNYHCEDVILTYKHFFDMNYKVGDNVRIVKLASNSNSKTMNLYKRSALQSEKI
ncbi:hypothetical protein D3C87_1486570 [compost metagenome]